MRALLTPLGYDVRQIEVSGCLHLQTAITELADGVVLVNPAWFDGNQLGGVEVIEVDPDEPFGANALRIGGAVIYPIAFPKTRARMEARGIRVVPVDVSTREGGGGVTLCLIV